MQAASHKQSPPSPLLPVVGDLVLLCDFVGKQELYLGMEAGQGLRALLLRGSVWVSETPWLINVVLCLLHLLLVLWLFALSRGLFRKCPLTCRTLAGQESSCSYSLSASRELEETWHTVRI